MKKFIKNAFVTRYNSVDFFYILCKKCIKYARVKLYNFKQYNKTMTAKKQKYGLNVSKYPKM